MVSSMEVKLDTNVDPVSHRPASPSKGRPIEVAADSVQFDQTRDLDDALRTTTDVRPDEVQRAQQLIGDVTYPPPETIRRIAALLAMNLDPGAM